MTAIVDASGVAFEAAAPPRRIVSLIPSITEILFALGAGDAMVGCTIFCTEPREGVARLTRVGGEKNPKLEVIRELRADLVVANIEENLREHVEALRAEGIAVFVTYPRTVRDGIALVRTLGRVTGTSSRGDAMAARLESAFATVRGKLAGVPPARVFCPIWRKPYMTLNADTYVHDMLAACGGLNVFGDRPTRYPEVTVAEIAQAAPEVILLPDEPYKFRRAHVADFEAHPDIPALRDGRVHLIDGKWLSWYGPRIEAALAALPPLLAAR